MRSKIILLVCCLFALAIRNGNATEFRAGAVAFDISPRTLPAIRNGGFLQAVWNRVDDPLFCRCLVVSDGDETIAIAIVDSCMLPTDVCDEIKRRVTGQIDLPIDRILISATHTHSAPSVMDYCLGTSCDRAYLEFVVPRIARAIVAAHSKLQPAEIGWSAIDAKEFTHCRRWITRGDKLGIDPFGQRSVRAMMHPGYLNPDYVCPAGPVDHELFVLSVIEAQSGHPICVLGNYSMHYFGSRDGFSADYFGETAKALETALSASKQTDRSPVAIMSQGTSGDLHWMDYSKPATRITRSEYAQGVADRVMATREPIEHRSDVTLAMAEKRITIERRLPSSDRLAWAHSINGQRGQRPPRDRPEVYAQQAIWIDQNRQAEVVLQAIRIGDLAITAIPNEVYSITGLKLKRQSPLDHTFHLELANGAEGYIPPPEQHRLGGYTTWPARTAGLAVDAEPRIVDSLLGLLEQVTGQPRRAMIATEDNYQRAVVATKPIVYWRLDDMTIDRAGDVMGAAHGAYRGAVALYLPGVSSAAFIPNDNRSVFFAGGTVDAAIGDVGNQYTAEMWFRNELPIDSRPVTGYLFSRGVHGAENAPGDSLGIGGTHSNGGRLFVYNGNGHAQRIAGRRQLELGQWYHVALVRRDTEIEVFLNGELEIAGELAISYPARCGDFRVGGRTDDFANFDGRIDEFALYDRALSRAEIAAHAALGR